MHGTVAPIALPAPALPAAVIKRGQLPSLQVSQLPPASPKARKSKQEFTVTSSLDQSQLVADAIVTASTMKSTGGKRSILLMYSFFAPNSEQDFWVSVENLRFFLQAAVAEEHPVVFLFLLIDGSDERQTWIPDLENVMVVHMDKQRADLCVYRTLFTSVLGQRPGILAPFKHFMFINNGVRGPFVDMDCSSDPWYKKWTERLDDDTPIVGSTVSCETPYPRHVQSFSFAVTVAGLKFVRDRWAQITQRQCRGASVAAPGGGSWRTDGRCGPSAGAGADGTSPAQCDPYSAKPVCDVRKGVCVQSMAECSGRGFVHCPDYGFKNKMDIVHAGEIGPSVDIVRAGLNLASTMPEYRHTDFRSNSLRHPLCSNEPGHRNGNPMKVPLEPLALLFVKYGGEAWRHRYLNAETVFRVQELSQGLLLGYPKLGDRTNRWAPDHAISQGMRGGTDDSGGNGLSCKRVKICGGAKLRLDQLLGEYLRVEEAGSGQGKGTPAWKKGDLLLQFSRAQLTPTKAASQWVVQKGAGKPLAKGPAHIHMAAQTSPFGDAKWQVYEPHRHRYKGRTLHLHCLEL